MFMTTSKGVELNEILKDLKEKKILAMLEKDTLATLEVNFY